MSRATPRRLCILGNSHVACLKEAEDAAPADLPPTDYFAASANLMADLRLDADGRLVAAEGFARDKMTAVAGTHSVEVAAYDAFALVGICIQFRDLLRLFRTHCLWRHRDWRAGRSLIGDPGFHAFVRALYLERPAYRLAREIRAVRPDARIVFAPGPMPTPDMFEDGMMRPLRSLRNTHYVRRVAELHRELAETAARTVDIPVTFQRPETLDRMGFTEARFNERGLGLRPLARAGRKPKSGTGAWTAERTDPWHMNTDFGRLRLEDIAAALRAA